MAFTLNLLSFFRPSSLVTRLSTAADGTQGNHGSESVQFSADGRYVVFESLASNLVADDTNGAADIFRKDLTTGAIVRVSTAAEGAQGDGESSKAHISADGRYVVFESSASNLVAEDTNNSRDIFRKDLETGEIVRVSAGRTGQQANGASSAARISADGRYVTFTSEADNLVAGDVNQSSDIFRKDLQTGELVCLSTTDRDAQGPELANGDSGPASFSPDALYVAFHTRASNLVDGDTNGRSDIVLVNAAALPHREAVEDGRFVQAAFAVGTAAGASIAWGDGGVDTATPRNGSVAFAHAYATVGVKAAVGSPARPGGAFCIHDPWTGRCQNAHGPALPRLGRRLIRSMQQ